MGLYHSSNEPNREKENLLDQGNLEMQPLKKGEENVKEENVPEGQQQCKTSRRHFRKKKVEELKEELEQKEKEQEHNEKMLQILEEVRKEVDKMTSQLKGQVKELDGGIKSMESEISQIRKGMIISDNNLFEIKCKLTKIKAELENLNNQTQTCSKNFNNATLRVEKRKTEVGSDMKDVQTQMEEAERKKRKRTFFRFQFKKGKSKQRKSRQ